MIGVRFFSSTKVHFVKAAETAAKSASSGASSSAKKEAKIDSGAGAKADAKVGAKTFGKTKITPDELIAQTKQQQVQQQEFKTSLLQGEFQYKPQILSENILDSQTNKPTPINVELLKFRPLKLDKTHGHEVATIKFRGYVEDDLLLSSEFASRAAYYLGIPVSGIIKQKTEKRLYTVIRSPFAQAKSKENFWRTTFNYKLSAFDANPEVVDLWLSYINKYAIEGVKYSAKLSTRESLDFVKQLDVDLSQIQVPQGYKETDNVVMNKVEELLKSEEFQKHFASDSNSSEARVKSIEKE